jgi:hypothetical protein
MTCLLACHTLHHQLPKLAATLNQETLLSSLASERNGFQRSEKNPNSPCHVTFTNVQRRSVVAEASEKMKGLQGHGMVGIAAASSGSTGVGSRECGGEKSAYQGAPNLPPVCKDFVSPSGQITAQELTRMEYVPNRPIPKVENMGLTDPCSKDGRTCYPIVGHAAPPVGPKASKPARTEEDFHTKCTDAPHQVVEQYCTKCGSNSTLLQSDR